MPRTATKRPEPGGELIYGGSLRVRWNIGHVTAVGGRALRTRQGNPIRYVGDDIVIDLPDGRQEELLRARMPRRSNPRRSARSALMSGGTKQLGAPGATSRLFVCRKPFPLGPSRLWQFTETPSAQVMPPLPRPRKHNTADSRLNKCDAG